MHLNNLWLEKRKRLSTNRQTFHQFYHFFLCSRSLNFRCSSKFCCESSILVDQYIENVFTNQKSDNVIVVTIYLPANKILY